MAVLHEAPSAGGSRPERGIKSDLKHEGSLTSSILFTVCGTHTEGEKVWDTKSKKMVVTEL